jgi:hypothetical protein
MVTLAAGTMMTCADAVKQLLKAKKAWEVCSAGKGKGCFGLDQCQARLYTAILRHAVLVMAALAIRGVTAALLGDRADAQAPPPVRPDAPPSADPGLIPLTVREVRRLLAAELDRPKPPGHAVHRLQWRRRHQARSRWFHQRARLARNYALVN